MHRRTFIILTLRSSRWWRWLRAPSRTIRSSHVSKPARPLWKKAIRPRLSASWKPSSTRTRNKPRRARCWDAPTKKAKPPSRRIVQYQAAVTLQSQDAEMSYHLARCWSARASRLTPSAPLAAGVKLNPGLASGFTQEISAAVKAG